LSTTQIDLSDAVGKRRSVRKSAGDGQQVVRALRVSTGFLLICAAIWLAAFSTDKALPYIKPGSDIMYGAKTEFIRTGSLLDMSKPVRILVIGNSKVMSGFIPAEFDRTVPHSSSYNCGIPNATVFVKDLAKAVERGQIPTHVLFAVEWEDAPVAPRNFFHFTGSDKSIMDALFPFRRLVRNGQVFILRSPKFGGLDSFYQQGERAKNKMMRDRGYYFIADQSRFPDQHLPAGFRLESDQPQSVTYRRPNLSSQAFEELHALAVKYGFKVLVVPYYLRTTERGAPGVNQEMVNALRPYPEFAVLGDEYDQFDNSYFSDIYHLNPAGAKIYTDRLAELVNRELQSEGAANAF
jgi:hypothetical protein